MSSGRLIVRAFRLQQPEKVIALRLRRRHKSRGQTLVEFALVFPVFIALVGGVIQFGMVFWAQNTLTQVVRDTGRWAATQATTPPTACDSTAAVTKLGAQAESIAANSSLPGHTSGEFSSPSDLTTINYTAAGDTAVRASTGAIAVAWVKDSDPATTKYPSGEGCPPKDNQAVYHVTIKINLDVPTFFPGMQFLPVLGTCDPGCHIVLSSTAQFRMEPKP